MKVRARVYSLEGKLLADKEESLDVPADASVKGFDLPKAEGLTMTFFVKLDLRNLRGKTVSSNFYWLSAKPDTLDWAHKQDTVYTPQAEFGDLTGLNSLPQVKLQTTALVEQTAGAATGKAHVRVKNPSSSVAFQVRLRLANKKGDLDVVPVFWEDNYFSLLPGEERIISVSYDTANLQGAHPVIQVGGFNIESGEAPPGASAAR
jgi:exo-1,4-beta-D-glucosaminidase